MMIERTVSVIIPAYNAEKFILDAVESLVSQTVHPNEVFVIDDGSTDCTYQIVREWIDSKDLPFPINLIHQDNAGLPATRNVGMRLSESKWIALLDADDIWENDHLAMLLEAIESVPSAVASYGAGRLFIGEEIQTQRYDDFWDNPSAKFGKPIHSTKFLSIDRKIFPRLLRGNFIKPSSLMFDAAVAKEIGMFDESLRTAEDREFLLRLIIKGPFVYYPLPITRYRWHDDNISQTKNARRNLENGMRVIQKIMLNRELGLDSEQFEDCRIELERAAKQYLYVSSQQGWATYKNSLSVANSILGRKTWLGGVNPKHVLRALMATPH